MPRTEAALLAVAAGAWLAVAGAAGPRGDTVAAAFGPDGRLWRATPMKDGLRVDSSADLGRTFSAPVRVDAKGARVQATAEDRPAIAVDARGRVYVVWAADARQPWTRYASVSTDDGRSFAPAVPLSTRAGDLLQYEPALQARGDGMLAVWMEDAGGGGHAGRGTLLLGALDPAAWGTPRAVPLHDAMCECCRLATAATPAGDTVVLGRFVIDGRVRDPGLVRIAADGTAGQALRITDDDWAIDACPEQGPALAVSASGRHHVAWFTLGSRRQGLYYAWSDDPGRTLSPPAAVGEARTHPAHPDLAATGRRVALVWQQFDGRATTVWARTSDDDGATWTTGREVARTTAGADYPRALARDGRLYASWFASDAGYRLLPLDP